MFCIQCEQTLSNDRLSGCQFKMGKCGMNAETSELQDLLIYLLQGISQYAHRARRFDEVNSTVDRFVPSTFFTTLTNVNFDEKRVLELINDAVQVRAVARALYENVCKKKGLEPEQLTGPAVFVPAQTREGRISQAPIASIKQDESGPDVFGLRCLLLYGLKGCSAYVEHALKLGQSSDVLLAKLHKYLDFLSSKPTDIEALLNAALAVGELNLGIMAMLDKGSTSRFGDPQPTRVSTSPVKGKAILVSGHDLVDLEAILKQTEGLGINVYTHGELLPAHGYPAFKVYPHLVGNYGSSWQNQQQEFDDFPGAIVMTSNCLIDPSVKSYVNRIFTTGPAGWPGVSHIKNQDYSDVIACAKSYPGFTSDLIENYVTVGFGRKAMMNAADTIVDAVKSGEIKHFFLMGGCDGAAHGRSYYTDFAQQAPDDTVILTSGCGKYRFNKSIHGEAGGIPRLLDVGQCNDTYSAIQVALMLANTLDCDVNDLPLTVIMSWLEQKAAAVLLTLLYLGVTNIHLGPSLPAYLSTNVVNLLVERFSLKPIGDAKEDISRIMAA